MEVRDHFFCPFICNCIFRTLHYEKSTINSGILGRTDAEAIQLPASEDICYDAK